MNPEYTPCIPIGPVQYQNKTHIVDLPHIVSSLTERNAQVR